MTLRNAPLTLIVLAILLVANSCKGSAPGTYKTEAVAVAAQVTEDLANHGKLSAATKTRFDALLAKYETANGQDQSFISLKSARDMFETMESDKQQSLAYKESAEAQIQHALRQIETEGQQ